jgi:hypothetical protein
MQHSNLQKFQNIHLLRNIFLLNFKSLCSHSLVSVFSLYILFAVFFLIIGIDAAPSNFDFASLYFANKLLLEKGSPYIQNSLPPYVYPPWFNFLTLPLNYFELPTAAGIWQLCNVLMIIGSVHLLSLPLAQPFQVILGSFFCILFLPAIGMLIVGQYTAPLMLGISAVSYGIATNKSFVAGIGLFLLTMKPHIGFFCFIIFMIRLFFERKKFSTKTLIFGGGIFFLAIFFSSLILPGWVEAYVKNITSFSEHKVYTRADTLASLAALGSTVTKNSSLYWAALLFTLQLFLFQKKKLFNLHDSFIIYSIVVVTAVTAVPYVRNYDLMLLGPVIWGIGQKVYSQKAGIYNQKWRKSLMLLTLFTAWATPCIIAITEVDRVYGSLLCSITTISCIVLLLLYQHTTAQVNT